jgi:hypothetical protein
MFYLQGGEDLPADLPLVPLACLDDTSDAEDKRT